MLRFAFWILSSIAYTYLDSFLWRINVKWEKMTMFMIPVKILYKPNEFVL